MQKFPWPLPSSYPSGELCWLFASKSRATDEDSPVTPGLHPILRLFSLGPKIALEQNVCYCEKDKALKLEFKIQTQYTY